MGFKEVRGRYNGPALEEEVLAFWREHNTFEESLQHSAGRPLFTFNEGPPTANGRPGIHHVLARSFKDAFPRYKTMRGYHAPRKAGWDTHGLPVEHEIEKELPLSPYDAEWEALGRGKDRTLYLPFTNIEMWVPKIFGALHAVVLLLSVRSGGIL